MSDKSTNKWWYVFQLVGILILMAYFILCDAPNENPNGHLTICIFHNITGYPCPGCGTVRGLKYFFHLDFYNTLMMNPLAVIIALYMVVGLVWITIDLVRGSDSFARLARFKLRWWMIVLVVVLAALNWWWNIEKGL